MTNNEEIKKRFENDNLEYRHLLPKKKLTLSEKKKFKEQRSIEVAERKSVRHENSRLRQKRVMKEYFQREKVKKKHKWRERIRIAAYKKLKMKHKLEYRFYVKAIKKKIYKKLGRVW